MMKIDAINAPCMYMHISVLRTNAGPCGLKSSDTFCAELLELKSTRVLYSSCFVLKTIDNFMTSDAIE